MKSSSLCKPWEHQISRRVWLGGTAGITAGALGLGDLLQPAVAADLQKKRKQVLFVWLDGGMSQLESWDPKPNTEFGGTLPRNPDIGSGHSYFRIIAANRQADAPLVRGPQPLYQG